MKSRSVSKIRFAALTAIVLLGYAASFLINTPGHYGPDALWQLAQGRSGVFNDWHPPVMAWLLGLADRFGRGAPLFIAFDGALFFGGLLAFALLEPHPRLITGPLLALLIASPLVLVYQGIVWKDVLFADASLSGFATLAWAGRIWPWPARRYAALAVALALFCLAGLSRQNGLIVPVFGALALSVIAFAASSRGAPRKRVVIRSAAHGLAFLALVAVGVGAATLAFKVHGDGRPETLNQWKRLQVFDLAGATRADPRIELSILHSRAPALERFIRDEAAPAYQAAGADNLEKLPGADVTTASAGHALADQWIALILQRPSLYLRTRTPVFLSILLTRSKDSCAMVFAGVDPGDPALLRAAGLQARYTARDQWVDGYESSFLGTPVFSHLVYGGLAVVLLAWALRELACDEAKPELIAGAAMLACALAFAASFFVISNACDYRYLYFLDVAALAALGHKAAGRRPPRVPAPGPDYAELLHPAVLAPSSPRNPSKR
ncbi:MAG: hypothetical protein ACYC8V_02995 [Caulobacteraceae bacterium]